MLEWERIPTRVSQAFWHDPSGEAADRFQPARAQLDPANPTPQPIYWLDVLLRGGLLVPVRRDRTGREPNRALTVLLTGPPGTGKSILATELCYRWARQGLRSHYATNEANPEWLIKRARDLWGQPLHEKEFHEAFECDDAKIQIREYSNNSYSADYISEVAVMFGLEQTIIGSFLRGIEKVPTDDPWDVVVVDSLNVISNTRDRDVLFRKIVNLTKKRKGPRIIIFILDSHSDRNFGATDFWEYMSDVVIRLDRTRPVSPSNDYLLRTIEIVKARYQEHVWGPHQLKPYPSYDSARQDLESIQQYGDRLARAHPFRKEGGIFIYPSIHYILSHYKRSDPSQAPEKDATPIDALTKMLGGARTNDGSATGGFPRARCTAFLGVRGGHKSHLGFMHVLNRILSEDESGLIVSLRDDEGTTMNTMKLIIDGLKLRSSPAWLDRPTDEILATILKERLEVMYFPPGNITPEEFLHRVLLSVLRLKRGGEQKVTLLFNSLDQLGPRFPLCAKEPVFTAALLQMLSGEGVTSIFIAAADRPEDATYHGLDSIAELILDFEHRKIPAIRYRDAVLAAAPNVDVSEVDAALKFDRLGDQQPRRSCVTLKVVRNAGGQAGGAQTILELIGANHPLSRVVPNELQCFPLT